MKRRRAIEVGLWTIGFGKAALLLQSCETQSPVAPSKDVITESPLIDASRIEIGADLTDQDKSALEDFLGMIDQEDKERCSIEDIESNLIVLRNDDSEFNAMLINSNGYFITVPHFFTHPVWQHMAAAQDGNEYPIERQIVYSPFKDYDFLIGKLETYRPMQFRKVHFSTRRNTGEVVYLVPAPHHRYRKKAEGKTIPTKIYHRENYFSTDLKAQNGHSGALVVNRDMTIVGIHHASLYYGGTESYEHKIEYLREMVLLGLKI